MAVFRNTLDVTARLSPRRWKRTAAAAAAAAAATAAGTISSPVVVAVVTDGGVDLNPYYAGLYWTGCVTYYICYTTLPRKIRCQQCCNNIVIDYTAFVIFPARVRLRSQIYNQVVARRTRRTCNYFRTNRPVRPA